MRLNSVRTRKACPPRPVVNAYCPRGCKVPKPASPSQAEAEAAQHAALAAAQMIQQQQDFTSNKKLQSLIASRAQKELWTGVVLTTRILDQIWGHVVQLGPMEHLGFQVFAHYLREENLPLGASLASVPVIACRSSSVCHQLCSFSLSLMAE